MQGTARALEHAEEDRALARLHAVAAQWEDYDDEADDGFEDLVPFEPDAAAATAGAW